MYVCMYVCMYVFNVLCSYVCYKRYGEGDILRRFDLSSAGMHVCLGGMIVFFFFVTGMFVIRGIVKVSDGGMIIVNVLSRRYVV